MRDALDRGLNVALTLAALVAAGALAHRELTTRAAAVAAVPTAPVRVVQWENLLRTGHRLGAAKTPVTVVEFADFECPFCRRFDSTFREVSRRFGGRVALQYEHFPLYQIHRFALPAARAAECAANQGQFTAMHDLLFAHQDSLGLKTWTSFAMDAGVSDTLRFAACMQRSTPVAAVDTGLSLGKAIGVRITPTVVVNGWLFSEPPSDSLLALAIHDALEGKSLENLGSH